MQKLDKLVLTSVLFAPLVAGLVGCGDGTKTVPRLDAAIDLAPDVASTDATKADALVPPDTANSDVSPAPDTANPDAPWPKDGAGTDVPRPPDASQDKASLDTSGVDATSPRDAGDQDAPPTLDAGTGEAGMGMDGAVAVDALAMAMPTITFRLDNTGTQTVYLRNQCWIPIEVASESDGTVHGNTFFCACDCADTGCTSNVQCGPCAPPAGVAIEAGTIMDISWIARKSTLENRTGPYGAFQCVAHAPIPTGAYRVAFVVYSSESDAVAETNGRTVAQGFALGTTNATVTVPIR